MQRAGEKSSREKERVESGKWKVTSFTSILLATADNRHQTFTRTGHSPISISITTTAAIAATAAASAHQTSESMVNR